MKAWSRSNQLVKVNPTSPGSVVIGAAHIVRGNPSLTDIKRNIEKYQQNQLFCQFHFQPLFLTATFCRFHKMSKFTSWSKQTSKVGLCSVPPVGHPASVLCLQNTTAMSAMFNEVKSQFDKLYKKKVHNYKTLLTVNYLRLYFTTKLILMHYSRLTCTTICKWTISKRSNSMRAESAWRAFRNYTKALKIKHP